MQLWKNILLPYLENPFCINFFFFFCLKQYSKFFLKKFVQRVKTQHEPEIISQHALSFACIKKWQLDMIGSCVGKVELTDMMQDSNIA